MKTRDSASSPPPVHVHVPETTPVHVHMRRSPSKTTQNKTNDDVLVKGDGDRGGGRPKARSPWKPPGRLSCRRDGGSYTCQTSRVRQRRSESGRHDDGGEHGEEAASPSLSVLLREQDGARQQRLKRGQHRDADLLLRTLVEAEIDGVAVANQLTSLKETVDGLTKDKRLSKLHAASLQRQRGLLLEKIGMYDSTNQSLRELLREWSEHERDSLIWWEQRDALKRRLADSEVENIRLCAKLTNKEKEASKLAEHLDFEKDNVKTTHELSRILESTRDHLERQLSRAEAEKIQLAAQIQRMQQSQRRQQDELQLLQEALHAHREQRDERETGRDQDALTLLTQKAERAEASARELADKLQQKETQLTQALSASSDWCQRHAKEAAAKDQLEEEASALRAQMLEISSQLRQTEERSRSEREELRDQLHRLSAENASVKLDNQRLQSDSTSSEEKLVALQSEARQLKSTVGKFENLVDKYKKKVQQARLDSEQRSLDLELTQKEARETQASLERQGEQTRRELLVRLSELEALRDRLSRTEQLLRDAEEQADERERRKLELGAALTELRHKVEQQDSQLETSQQRNLLLQEENDSLKEKTHNLERRLEDAKLEREEMCQRLDVKDASVRSVQQQLEEKTVECSVLSRQLQQALDDAQRQVDDNMQKVLSKEKVTQSKALDMQSQLSRAKTELSQLQRSKEDMERRFQNQLQNMKERLAQSDSTNRSLKNYVHFLKTSYVPVQ